MFVALDTNHVREFVLGDQLGMRLRQRLEAAGAEVFVPIVVAEEALHGWVTLIRQCKAGPAQIEPYARLQTCIAALHRFDMLPFDREGAERYLLFRSQRIRIGTMDLKIAAICLAHDATLLTRNLIDFQKVPGLRVENWLD
jgi:tRNA(fMet)-specific endonuclease VapC